MVWIKLIPVFLSVPLLCAHYLRNGDYAMIFFWLASISLLFFKRSWTIRAFQILLLGSAGIWVSTIIRIMQARLMIGEPWVRMAVILGAVALLTIGSALILNRKKIGERLVVKNQYTSQSLAAYIVTFVLLAIVQSKVSFPVLITERFAHNLGWLEILALSIYAGWLTEKMMDVFETAKWRRRIWLAFSIVFFSQFLIGLAGVDKFLMTGNLHIPVPAIILAGPIFRGNGLFMPILFICTVILVGPAWCSYLCYIGSWDHRASMAKRKPIFLPFWRHPIRIVILVIIPIIAILLRLLGASTLFAAIAGIGFGIAGVIIMMTWSRKTGAMSHCITWCPIGLLANWLGRISPFRLRINDTCNDCGACGFACRYEALTVGDIQNRKPGITCTLCGDCINRCSENSIEYRFVNLSPQWARALFLVIVISLHAAFMGLARI
jgi:NAD-dependent dihydropyrimidine dehydrogenase PreA subunit